MDETEAAMQVAVSRFREITAHFFNSNYSRLPRTAYIDCIDRAVT